MKSSLTFTTFVPPKPCALTDISQRSSAPIGPGQEVWTKTVNKFWSHPDCKPVLERANYYGLRKFENLKDWEFVGTQDRLKLYTEEFDHIQSVYLNSENGEFDVDSLTSGAVFYSKPTWAEGYTYSNFLNIINRNLNSDDRVIMIDNLFFTSMTSVFMFGCVFSGATMFDAGSRAFDCFIDKDMRFLWVNVVSALFCGGITSVGFGLVVLHLKLLLRSAVDRFKFEEKTHSDWNFESIGFNRGFPGSKLGEIYKALPDVLDPYAYYDENPLAYTSDVERLLSDLENLAKRYQKALQTSSGLNTSAELDRIREFQNKIENVRGSFPQPRSTMAVEDHVGAVSIVGSEDLRGRVSLVANRKDGV